MPATSTRPATGSCNPHRTRMKVVFPAPLGPRKPKISPAPIDKETLSTAVNEPKRQVTPSALIDVLPDVLIAATGGGRMAGPRSVSSIANTSSSEGGTRHDAGMSAV